MCNCIKDDSYKIALRKAKVNETSRKKWGVYFIEDFKEWGARPINEINKMSSVCCFYDTDENEVKNEVKTTKKSSKDVQDV